MNWHEGNDAAIWTFWVSWFKVHPDLLKTASSTVTTHAGRDQHHRHQQFVVFRWCGWGTDLNLISLLVRPRLNPSHDGNKNVFQRKYVVLGCKKWCIYIWNYINTVLQITNYTIIDTNTLWTMSKGGQQFCFIPLKTTHCFLSHQDKKQEQRGWWRSGHRSLHGWPSAPASTAKKTRLEGGPKGPFHQGNIGGFDLNIHQMELNNKKRF